MTESKKTCCYKRRPLWDGVDRECQFQDEPDAVNQLTELAGLFFCPFHLPFSSETISVGYGANESANHPDLKANWPMDRIRQFDQDINRRLTKALETNAECDLEGTVFPNGASFARQTFPQVNFSRCHFPRSPASFSDARFTASILFYEAKFSGVAFFDRAQFTKKVSFMGAQFSSSASFASAQFEDPANFKRAQFMNSADFSGKATPADADQPNDTFNKLDFTNSVFSDQVWFHNRVFLDRTSFENVTFNIAPEFHGCTLHENTTFPFIDGFKDTRDSRAAHSYRTLRLAMKVQESHEAEDMFWSLEQKSKRKCLNLKHPRNWAPWMLSAFYGGASNYGLSVNRPISLNGAWFFIIAPFVYFSLRDNTDRLISTITYSDLLGFSLAQSVRPFLSWSDYDGSEIRLVLGDNIDVLSVKLFATADSLISLILLALLILAVRRRFRMQ